MFAWLDVGSEQAQKAGNTVDIEDLNEVGNNGDSFSLHVTIRARLTKCQRQRCDNSAMILMLLLLLKTIALKWVANPFWSDSNVFNDNRVVAALTLMLGVNGP